MSLIVAVIGAGFMGRVHAESYYKGNLDARVGWVVASRLERAEALAGALPGMVRATTDYQAILDDPAVDAVDICVPTPLHYEYVLRAAAAGKHVLCEKPMAVTVAEADAMIAACRTAGVQLMVAHVLRFWPEYVTTVGLVKDGRIGAVRHVVCQRLSQGSTGWDQDGWIHDPAQGGGAVRDLAIHDYDVINWLIGLPSVVCAAGDVNHFSALFRTADGPIAQVEASFKMPPGSPFIMSLRVVGDTGAVTFDGLTGTVTLLEDGVAHVVPVEGSRVFAQDTSAEIDAYYHEIAYFLECVRTGARPARALPQDARDALWMADLVQEALV
jgi:predicted dehydrogenase